MTLKETLVCAVSNLFRNKEEKAEWIEQIADEFAIGFSEFIDEYDYNGFKDTKELLEIYKKEKGL